ncbi:MAG: preprotein translocase subunit SecE [Candidatus Eremiobacteraeota bacterium]|nr:preprotein translocase subunit SecE [Candidatus Eremiobacteraeota bacterium]
MNRPTGGSGTTVRPGPGRVPVRPSGDRAARQQNAERFIRDLVNEMRRVTWPSRPEWVSATILTIGLVISIGLYTYILDQVFGLLFGAIHK